MSFDLSRDISVHMDPSAVSTWQIGSGGNSSKSMYNNVSIRMKSLTMKQTRKMPKPSLRAKFLSVRIYFLWLLILFPIKNRLQTFLVQYSPKKLNNMARNWFKPMNPFDIGASIEKNINDITFIIDDIDTSTGSQRQPPELNTNPHFGGVNESLETPISPTSTSAPRIQPEYSREQRDSIPEDKSAEYYIINDNTPKEKSEGGSKRASRFWKSISDKVVPSVCALPMSSSPDLNDCRIIVHKHFKTYNPVRWKYHYTPGDIRVSIYACWVVGSYSASAQIVFTQALYICYVLIYATRCSIEYHRCEVRKGLKWHPIYDKIEKTGMLFSIFEVLIIAGKNTMHSLFVFFFVFSVVNTCIDGLIQSSSWGFGSLEEQAKSDKVITEDQHIWYFYSNSTSRKPANIWQRKRLASAPAVPSTPEPAPAEPSRPIITAVCWETKEQLLKRIQF